MGSSDKFCLRWNDFESTISSSFRELRQTSEFFDVTLCCDNGTDTLQAHKVILAACSPLFRRILGQNTHQNPFLYLKGIHLKELQNVLNFMYHGEVSVAQDSLNKFLAVAEELAVKGLTTLETNEAPQTFYDHDDDDDDEVDAPPPKRSAANKKSKRQSFAATSKRKAVEAETSDVTMEVDLKRIKADPDEDDGRGGAGGGGGGGDNGEMFEGDDYEGLGQFDDDFDEGAGNSGAGTSGGDGKARVGGFVEEAQFSRTTRGNALLCDSEGYCYIMNRSKEDRIYWVCRNRKKKCKGTAVTQGFFIVKKYVQHNHKPVERFDKEDD